MNEWKGLREDYKDYLGFVYRITNTTNGKYYIGLKLFYHKKTLKPLKGRKNKRRRLVESDWSTYYGSCASLLEDIELLGEENFDRQILHHCKSKFDCAYNELLEQISNDVLFDIKSYNGIINVRLSRKKR